jgi:hypothetical protein
MVLLLRFSGEFTQDEIASRMHVSQMQVSRILRNATAALAGAPELHDMATSSFPAQKCDRRQPRGGAKRLTGCSRSRGIAPHARSSEG